jgi:hypothetical protein
VVIHSIFYFFCWWHWSLNLGLHNCSYHLNHLAIDFFVIFFKRGSH